MFRIRRFGVIKTATVVALWYVVIIVIIFLPIAVLVALFAPSSGVVGNAGGLAVVFFGLLLALFYGLLGWVFTALACVFYNLVAGMTGGIEIQLEAVEPRPAVPVWGAPATAPSSEPPPGAPPG
jgi:hypothetical protein